MKVAFVGKGGSGKTTLSALFCRYLASLPVPVVAFDADINQHLGAALGLSETDAAEIPALGLEMDRIKDYLRGSNPRIPSAAAMTKTTPPGRGSRLWSTREDNAIFSHFARDVDGVKLLATGPFSEHDLGLKCYHSKVGAVELLLNHCADEPETYIVVDMTAGADSFASGLFTRFDLTFLIVEPTRKSLGVYQQYKHYTDGYNVKLKVIANKVVAQDDLTFIREHVGNDLLAWVSQSAYIRAMEKGKMLPFSSLEIENRDALTAMKLATDDCEQDWDTFYRQAVAFHRKNAASWMNAALGEDVTEQIDPDFSLSSEIKRRTENSIKKGLTYVS